MGETRAKEWEVGETGAKETGGKGSGQNVMEGIELKSYSADRGGEEESDGVCGGFDSYEDRDSLKQGRRCGGLLVVAKIEAITERVKNIVGSGKGGSVLVHVRTNNVEREGTTAIVRK